MGAGQFLTFVGVILTLHMSWLSLLCPFSVRFSSMEKLVTRKQWLIFYGQCPLSLKGEKASWSSLLNLVLLANCSPIVVNHLIRYRFQHWGFWVILAWEIQLFRVFFSRITSSKFQSPFWTDKTVQYGNKFRGFCRTLLLEMKAMFIN